MSKVTPELLRADARREASSFRDPAGFVFWRDGRLFRHLGAAYLPHYERLMASGLYQKLVDKRWLVSHEEREASEVPAGAARLLEPELLPFISHPYEWSFSMLKAAALLTLDLQAEALAHGMTLKDASAYNVQFRGAQPVFIDTLSFECRHEQAPWPAYRQFCQHFVAPLALMAHTDVRLAALLRTSLDGIPLDLASRLLPRRTWLSVGLAAHLHLHARAERRQAGADAAALERRAGAARVRPGGVRAIVQNLRDTLAALEWRAAASTWSDYYATAAHYGASGVEEKTRIVDAMLRAEPPGLVWDFGANTGHFSRLAAQHHRTVVAWDFDPLCVERMFRHAQEKPGRVTPLVMDLANPSASQGWAQAERRGLLERGPADVTLALGLMHHLVLAAQVPLAGVAGFLAQATRSLIIEFVPMSDPQASLLASRLHGGGHQYDQDDFERHFSARFRVVAREPVPGTERIVYHYQPR